MSQCFMEGCSDSILSGPVFPIGILGLVKVEGECRFNCTVLYNTLSPDLKAVLRSLRRAYTSSAVIHGFLLG